MLLLHLPKIARNNDLCKESRITISAKFSSQLFENGKIFYDAQHIYAYKNGLNHCQATLQL